ncbi:hypothetical protein CF319_g6371 [Tilletia indica]|uniref:Mitochondrial outer membrane protein OM14 C-terminal domain-containing protein n=2 Tax=Tilletia TaxID=13289 RepID=A0A8X7N260_9BASI|nr:hypothetical protein CF327_g6342 [Tilletia walkeri]KAE8220043.1 hypothetical protein CF319_g6371 [Tilletia indica]KAE8228502.1 hypothetical protein CF326_g6565 [Tilletia indica]KAE8244615.1 hypothetical protein A4X13_0g6435 [Tilletia indica]KAE8265336.1 hypothetical protein A4X09_0g6686 [Tilletia walkeri]
MSYADIAKANAPPSSTADPAFLEGSYNQPPTDGHGAADIPSDELPDVNSRKVNVVPAGTDLHTMHTQSEQTSQETEERVAREKEQLEQRTRETQQRAREEAQHVKEEAQHVKDKATEKAKNLKADAKDGLQKAEKKISKTADDASRQAKKSWNEFSSDPKKWASSLGAVNIAILGGLGIYAYTQRATIKTWDKRFIAAVVGGIGAVLGLQAYAGTEKAREQEGRK